MCSEISKFNDLKILKINLDILNDFDNKINDKGIEIIKKGLEKLHNLEWLEIFLDIKKEIIYTKILQWIYYIN